MRETVEERSAHMRKIPEKAYEWANSLFKNPGFIYYKRNGRYVTCFCGSCGAKYEGVCRPHPDPFFAGAEHRINPRHNEEGICERCGIRTKYKSEGKAKETFVHAKGRWVIGQKMGKNEFVFRIFDIEQIMHRNDRTEYDYMEYIRIFLRPGKKAQKDYYVHDPWSGRDRWIDHNLGGMRNIETPDYAEVFPGTFKEISKTPMFQFVPAIKGNYKGNMKYPITRYYEAAAHYDKDFEFLVKANAEWFVHKMVWKYRLGYRTRGKTYYDRIGVYKERVPEISNTKADYKALEIYQAERKSGKHWKEEDIKAYRTLSRGLDGNQLKTIEGLFKYASPGKILNYLSRATGENIWHSHSREVIEYVDYIRMRKQAGYDLSNEIILFPKDLHRRHNEMVLETEKEEIEKRAKEVNEKYPGIERRYKKLMEKYSAAAGGYYIRPAKDAAEIVMEGKLLHHCVGGNGYLSRHATGKSTILFLRRTAEKDMPWITVEIIGTKVKQWYGAYDRKDEKAGINQERMQAWLDTYCRELEKRSKEAKSVRKSGKSEEKRQKTA